MLVSLLLLLALGTEQAPQAHCPLLSVGGLTPGDKAHHEGAHVIGRTSLSCRPQAEALWLCSRYQPSTDNVAPIVGWGRAQASHALLLSAVEHTLLLSQRE